MEEKEKPVPHKEILINKYRRNKGSIYSKISVDCKGKNNNSTLEEPGKYHLIQVMKVNIICRKTY